MTNKLPDMNQFAIEYLDLASKYEKLHKEYPLITEAYGVKVAPLSIDRSESMIYDFSYQYQDEYEFKKKLYQAGIISIDEITKELSIRRKQNNNLIKFELEVANKCKFIIYFLAI